MALPTRETAMDLFKQFNKSDSLMKHALAVEAVMRYMARKRGRNENEWGIIGLVHDIDWEMYPENHCVKAREILSDANWPEEWTRAVISHGWGICSDVEPLSDLEKVLYAVDELTGLVNTTALVRPSKSILDVKVKSVKKKWKDKRFAAGVDRGIIEKGCERLGMELPELIEDTIMGMREAADSLGLAGVEVKEP